MHTYMIVSTPASPMSRAPYPRPEHRKKASATAGPAAAPYLARAAKEEGDGGAAESTATGIRRRTGICESTRPRAATVAGWETYPILSENLSNIYGRQSVRHFCPSASFRGPALDRSFFSSCRGVRHILLGFCPSFSSRCPSFPRWLQVRCFRSCHGHATTGDPFPFDVIRRAKGRQRCG